MAPEKQSIAVIGAGISGLAATKNFLEVGFDVTTFERQEYIAGLWKYTDAEDVTSVLETTVVNVSKYKNCYTDFPFPKDYPAHPTARQVCDYLDAYATQFDLHPHIRLKSRVEKVTRNADDTKWRVHVLGGSKEEKLEFDKVALCTGNYGLPKLPVLEGKELFKGKIIHAQAYKRPSDYAGKRVVVLGLGNTAADTATSLVGHAGKIYLSHRRGTILFRRTFKGKPLDLILNRRGDQLKHRIAAAFPRLSQQLQDAYVGRISAQSFVVDPSWNFTPRPSVLTHQPVISDSLVDYLAAGSITSVVGFKRFVSDHSIELNNGTVLEDIDAVICCTGYAKDFSLVEGINPTENTPSVPGFESAPLARLYQNTFPPAHADSLAYLNHVAFTTGATTTADLHTTAVAQIWAGAFSLPSETEMNQTVERHFDWVCSLGRQDVVYTDIIDEGKWLPWVNAAAGNGVNEYLGYGLQGWMFWLKEMSWCNKLMTGLDSPHVYRLFEGRRKKWEGAAKAIEEAYREVEERYGK